MSPRLLHGLRLSASVCLALLVAFWLRLDNPYWAGTSAGIVCQPHLGASLRKGQFRAVGTVIGATFILVLTASGPQSRTTMLLGLALWIAACSFVASVLANFAGYAAALAGYTAAIVFAEVIANPANVFEIAVTRAIEINIGIFAAGLVHALTDFGDGRVRLARALADIGKGVATGLSATLAVPQETTAMRHARRDLIRRVIGLEATIDQAAGEPSHLRYHSSALRACVEALFTALSAWRGIANHLVLIEPDSANAAAAALLPAVSPVADRDWLNDPQGARATCSSQALRVEQAPAAGVSAQLLAGSAAQALHALERVANGLVLVTGPRRARADHGAGRPQAPDLLPAGLNALRALVALLAAEGLWVALAWPEGPTMITFAAIAITLFSPREDAAYASAVEFAVGCAGAVAVAILVDLAILPSQDGFVALCVVLAAVLTPLAVLSAGTWRTTAFAALVTNVMPILAIDSVPGFDAAQLFNSGLAILAGTTMGAAFMRLAPPMSPAGRTRRLLRLTLRDLRRVAIRRRRLSSVAWTGLTSRRLAALPAQATLEDEARLLAGLSVGEATIALMSAHGRLAAREALDRALASLAEADVAGARRWLDAFRDGQADESPAPAGFHPAAVATVIDDALARHPEFFGSMVMTGPLAGGARLRTAAG